MNRVYFVSLGCDKNLCDSEHMLHDLLSNGYEIIDDPYEADVIVINSCSFIEDAMQESIDTVIELGDCKENGRCKALILAGCLGQRFSDDIATELPEVDAVVGTNSWDDLTGIIDRVLGGNDDLPVILTKELKGLPKAGGRVRTDPIPASYLKIAEGCDKRCTYCIIPYIRGSYRSVPMDELLKEASDLVSKGLTEISLVAQEVTLYGVDLYGKKSLPELLKKLSMIKGLSSIRLLYCYPEEIDEDLIEVMSTEKKVCHYIDMPIQHCNDDILRRMGRHTTKADIKSTVKHLRDRIPDIAIRTTLIAGFPGEDEAAHEEMVSFVKEMEFDRLGCFAYSREEGTPAAQFDDQVDDEVKQRRVDDIMQAQRDVTLRKNDSLKGQVLNCFIEGRIEDGVYIARSYRDAIGVDSSVFVETDRELISGEFYDVKITGFQDYDLIGEL